MTFQAHDGMMSDVTSLPLQGTIFLQEQLVMFKPATTKNSEYQTAFNPSDIKCITFQDIGYRHDSGPFFEITFYLKDSGRIYTFGNYHVDLKGQISEFIKNNYSITPIFKDIAPTGWNFGHLSVGRCAVAFQEWLGDDSDSDFSGGEDQHEHEGESQEGSEDSSSDPGQTEFFHLPTNLISFVQRVGNRDLIIELQPNNEKDTVYVKQMQFAFPTDDQRQNAFERLQNYCKNIKANRILLLENLMCYMPSSARYNLEFGQTYFRFISSKELKKGLDDIVRIFLVKRNEKMYYIALEFSRSKKLKDADMLVIEVSSKVESRDVTLPSEEENLQLRQRLIECLTLEQSQINELGLDAYDDANEEFGPNSMLQKTRTGQQLRGIPQFIVVYKLFLALCPSAKPLMDEAARSSFLFQDFANKKCFSVQSEGIMKCCFSVMPTLQRQTQREYQLYVVDKYILLLPYEGTRVAINELSSVNVDFDHRHSGENLRYATLSLQYRGGANKMQFVRVHYEDASTFTEYLRDINPTLNIYDRFNDERRGVDDSSEDDEDWNESEQSVSSDDAYEYDEGSAGESESSKPEPKTQDHISQSQAQTQVNKKEKVEKQKTQKQKRNYFEEAYLVTPEPADALLDVQMPSTWPGFKQVIAQRIPKPTAQGATGTQEKDDHGSQGAGEGEDE